MGNIVALERPPPKRRHVSPGPGLVDKDKAVRLDAILIPDPLRSPPRYVRTIAFASRHAFFEAQLLGVHKLPDRAVIDLQPAISQFGHKAA
jgi:hypothetical protein